MTAQHYRYIFLVLDVASKFVRLYPIKKPSGAAAIDCLFLDYFPNHGRVTSSILADNGSQFTSNLWKDTLRKANIKPIFIAIRHPSANPAERYMRTLAQCMRAALQGKPHNQWHLQIGQIERTFNETIHASTSEIPYVIFCGRKVRRNWDPVLGSNDGDDRIDPIEIEQRINSAVVRAANESRNRARRHDVRKNKVLFNCIVGDEVLVKSLSVSSAPQGIYHKFLNKNEGPYKISKNFGNGSYQLNDPETNTVKGIYHVSHLKKYFPPL
uniref:Integrase catalytic domain-containing protein n=1 Tax=Lygus hesperus TaxID=30085 RepID=A0A0A9Y6A0_LYGHE